jgi:hypothetical protein
MPINLEDIGTGPTEELCLRVSAATLVRVVFPHPAAGQTMLALERKATLRHEGERQSISVTAQPFGGSIRIIQPTMLLEQIGDFHFDSPRSRAEQDFRILIRPADWEIVKHYCIREFRSARVDVLEKDPVRELEEEFVDTLQEALLPTQYRLNPLELLVENAPVKTDNSRAVDLPTVRIYTVFEAALVDPALIRHLLENSAHISDQKLIDLATEDARRGGKGRANAVLAVPIDLLTKTYLNLPPERRNDTITIEGHHLERNVPSLFREVFVPRYERFFL